MRCLALGLLLWGGLAKGQLPYPPQPVQVLPQIVYVAPPIIPSVGYQLYYQPPSLWQPLYPTTTATTTQYQQQQQQINITLPTTQYIWMTPTRVSPLVQLLLPYLAGSK